MGIYDVSVCSSLINEEVSMGTVCALCTPWMACPHGYQRIAMSWPCWYISIVSVLLVSKIICMAELVIQLSGNEGLRNGQ